MYPDNDDADGEYNSDDSGDDDEDDESDVEVETVALPEIQVEFEARTPEPTDFDGIKRFLFKLFNNSSKIDYNGARNLYLHARQTVSQKGFSFLNYIFLTCSIFSGFPPTHRSFVNVTWLKCGFPKIQLGLILQDSPTT